MRIVAVAGLTVLVGLGGCAGTTAPEARVGASSDAAAVAPMSPIAGTTAVKPPSSCVELSRIRETRVVDDRTIDFVMNDRQVLRNTLPFSCPQLGFERAFTYSTSLSRLCSVDIITVLVQGGGIRRGASCGLGSFVPYTPVPGAK